MTAIEDGIVLGHSDSSVAFPGVPIMAFGIAEKRDIITREKKTEPSSPK